MNIIKDDNEEFHIPARLLSHKIFSKQLFVSKKRFIYVLITEKYEFYELLNKNIINKVYLEESLREIKKDKCHDINLRLYFRYADSVDGPVDEFYLLQFDDTLIVIKRDIMEIVECHNQVLDYNITINDSLPFIKIKFKDESGLASIVTNFLRTAYDSMDYEQCVSDQTEEQNIFFSDSLILLENKITNNMAELSVYEELTNNSVFDEICEARFGTDSAK